MMTTKLEVKAVNFNVETRQGNAFLLNGDDLYFRDKVIKDILSLVPEAEREFNYHNFSDVKSIEEAETAFTSMGFFGGVNVIVISGYGAKKSGKGELKLSEKEVKLFESLINSMDENTVLIMHSSNLPLSLSRYFVKVDCGKLDAVSLRSYVPSLIAPLKIDGNALYTLIEYCNRDMMSIYLELEKLKAYMGSKQVITLEMVQTLVANTIENDIFELSKALAERNKFTAVSLFEKFVAKGIGFSVILGTLINQYRRLLHVALSKKSDRELAEVLRVKEYAVIKSRETAKKYGKATLKACLDELVDAEYNFKSGLMTEETAVRTAIANLIAK